MAASPSPLTPRVEPLGDQALLVVLGSGIDRNVNDRVHQLVSLIRERRLPGVHDLVPAYATLAVQFDPCYWTGAALEQELLTLLGRCGLDAPPAPRQIAIPVCYGGSFGPDLAEVASRCGLSEREVIARHAAVEYPVYMLGFAPGFPYLGGLDPAIATPRRATPRARVPAGSVGIAGLQTGIYPLELPGGWQIIGRTPCRLFRPDQEPPCLLGPGDRLRFVPIDPTRFQDGLESRP